MGRRSAGGRQAEHWLRRQIQRGQVDWLHNGFCRSHVKIASSAKGRKVSVFLKTNVDGKEEQRKTFTLAMPPPTTKGNLTEKKFRKGHLRPRRNV